MCGGSESICRLCSRNETGTFIWPDFFSRLVIFPLKCDYNIFLFTSSKSAMKTWDNAWNMFKRIWKDFTFYPGVSIGFEPVTADLVWINNFQECQTQSKFTIKTEKFVFISQLQWPVLLSRKVINCSKNILLSRHLHVQCHQ